MSHKVKEEIPLWHTDHLQSTHTNVCSGLTINCIAVGHEGGINVFHLVWDFHKEAETFSRLEQQPAWDVLTEIFCSGARLHLEGLHVSHAALVKVIQR